MNKIIVIPARSGSKGVLNKNIKKLNGKELLVYSIETAKKIVPPIRIVVSTDSEEYAIIARKHGAEVPFIRPASIALDNSTDFELFEQLHKWFIINENINYDIAIHLRPTTPLRDINIINEAIEVFEEKKPDSLRSGHKAIESPFKWFMKDDEGYFKGLDPKLTPEDINMARQSFEPVYISNGYIDIFNLDNIIKHKSLHGEKMYIYETPLNYQVDSIEDFDFLEFKTNKK